MASIYAAQPSPVRAVCTVAVAVVAAALAGLMSGCNQRPESGDTPAASPVATAAVDQGELCRRIEAVLTHARDARRLDAAVHGAWQVVHGILAFGPDFPLRHDGTESSALGYLLDGGRLTGFSLRAGSPGVVAVVEEGSTTGQGHPDQWLGYLAQCGRRGIPRDTKLVVGGKAFTVGDLLTQAQADIRPGQEATWTLMALSAYLPTDASWTAGDGERWTTERVVAMEADADIFSSACGGAHRLYGLATALAKHCQATGRTPAECTGDWEAAADVIEECIDRARRFQQADGSFSIHSFERPGTSPDVFARLSATGHVFEVLALALDDERLAEPWVVRAADRLTTLLEQTADVDVECGALYHAVHGLLLYKQRVCRSIE
ncbi:MAG: ADP-ribosylation factor-directed GTPase activating protein isoform b [Planctomycetia bacterium]